MGETIGMCGSDGEGRRAGLTSAMEGEGPRTGMDVGSGESSGEKGRRMRRPEVLALVVGLGAARVRVDGLLMDDLEDPAAAKMMLGVVGWMNGSPTVPKRRVGMMLIEEEVALPRRRTEVSARG